VWWIAIELAPDAPIRWTITAATGKYEGLAMSNVNNAIGETRSRLPQQSSAAVAAK